MLYPYRCLDCGPFEVVKSMADASRAEACPDCGAIQTQQDFSAKSLGGYLPSSGNWSEGKLVQQLHPKHPDRMVTSRSQMEKVYKKHGISMETGHFKSKEAQIDATVPRSRRKHAPDIAVGGVIEQD